MVARLGVVAPETARRDLSAVAAAGDGCGADLVGITQCSARIQRAHFQTAEPILRMNIPQEQAPIDIFQRRIRHAILPGVATDEAGAHGQTRQAAIIQRTVKCEIMGGGFREFGAH